MTRLLYTAAAVRGELYGIWNALQESHNDHLVAWSRHPGGHPNPCRLCDDYSAKKAGINWAVRHFGGRPRR